MPVSENFRILREKNLLAVLFTKFSGLGIDRQRRKPIPELIPLWNSPGKKEFFRASLYVWYLQYWALCDDLVDFKL